MLADSKLDLHQEFAELNNANLEELRRRWQSMFGRAAPATLPRPLLLRLYAYRRQADVHGDLAPGTILLLERLARARTDDRVPLPAVVGSGARLRPGTVLVREHGGKNHHVMVVAHGYAWNGVTFPSLSLVAKAITGTKWNGPRFFGLRDKKRAP
jgi:hypothetical protein